MKVQATTADAYQLVHDGILALARAERQGIRIDVEYCEKKKVHLERKIKYQEKQLENTKLYRRWNHIFGAKTNILSNQQLSHLLYKNMKIEPEKTTGSGQGATDEEALSRLGIPELDMILNIRKLSKIKTTYLEAFLRLQSNSYIHPFFNLHIARTFRSSSSDPNFQNIPKRDKEAMEICRRAILPRPGNLLLEADYSALEVNISVCYHKDPNMMKYLLDKNSDMHADMAKQIFMMDSLDKKIPEHALLRQSAKNGFVFPQFYGDYYGNNAHSIARHLDLPKRKWKGGEGVLLPGGESITSFLRSKGIKSFQAFTDHLGDVENDFWNRRFKGYGEWRKKSVKEYQKKGFLQMYTGFVCSGLMRKNEIVNYPIQGSAFHCLLFTFIELDKVMRKEKWDSRLIGQIHDSIVMDVNPKELSHVKDVLNDIVSNKLPKAWKWIIVPLEIEVEEYEIDSPWIH